MAANIYNACTTLIERLKPYKKKSHDGNWKQWIREAFFNRVCLSAVGHFAVPGTTPWDFTTQKGKQFLYFTSGTAVTEDCLTGDHRVLRTYMDVGDSLNLAIDIGHIEGAFVQGQGLLTLEELRYSPDGCLLTRGPGMYKLPGVSDITNEFNVTLLRDSPNPYAVYSSRCPFDTTPNEVILKIFSYLDGLSDRSALAQVSHRMNILANDGSWRKRIKISREEFDKFSTSSSSRRSFVEALINEVAVSYNLNSLIIELPFNAHRDWRRLRDDESLLGRAINPKYDEYKELLTMIKDRIQQMTNYYCNCTITEYYSYYYFIAYFFPKRANDKFKYPYFYTTSIEFEGKDSNMLEKILENSDDSLCAVRAQCPITLSLLTQIGKYTDFESVHLCGELILPSKFNVYNLPKIKTEYLSLGELRFSQQSHQISKIIAAIAYSEILHELDIPSFLSINLMSEILSRCPNLNYHRLRILWPNKYACGG